jgi:hypothetical protein
MTLYMSWIVCVGPELDPNVVSEVEWLYVGVRLGSVLTDGEVLQ